jgi:small GTP-binding protein
MAQQQKICFVGDGGVGKTCCLQRLLFDRDADDDFNSEILPSVGFRKQYIPTLGVEVHPVMGYTIWDCSGQGKYQGLGTEYWKDCNIFVVFYDCTSKLTYKHAMGYWTDKIKKYNPNAKLYYVCTKIDIESRKVNPIENHIQISAKNRINLYKLFEHIRTN